MKHLTGILAILVMIFVGLACSGGDETSKANELVDQANTFVKTANESLEKVNGKFNDYQAKVAAIKSDADVTAAKDFGKTLFPLCDELSQNFNKAGDKFDEASKLKVDPKFKEYLDTLAKEMKMRGDEATEIKKIPQALIDSTKKADYEQQYNTISEKVKKMLADAKDLDDKATKIQKDNPTLIAQPK